jgi:purine-binding chemotaxis protein CheW
MKRPGRGRLEAAAAGEQVLLFRVGEGQYGIGMRGLWEVLPPEGVTGLPTPGYQICTVLAYRGRSLPLVRLGELFGASVERVPPGARVLLVQGGGQPLGLLVDEVQQVVEVAPKRIAPMPAQATELSPSLFRGLVGHGGGVVVLVDADGLGGLAEVRQFAGN